MCLFIKLINSTLHISMKLGKDRWHERNPLKHIVFSMFKELDCMMQVVLAVNTYFLNFYTDRFKSESRFLEKNKRNNIDKILRI